MNSSILLLRLFLFNGSPSLATDHHVFGDHTAIQIISFLFPTSALLSAFFSKLRTASTDFFGHRPWAVVLPSTFACDVLPTPPQNRLKGIHLLCSSTSSRYLLALSSCILLIAKHVSRVFLKCTRKSAPLDYTHQPSMSNSIPNSLPTYFHIHIPSLRHQCAQASKIQIAVPMLNHRL